jgi:ketosteroid isomerase-like protein
MPINAEYIRELFGNLEAGKPDAFFAHVSDRVDWTVMGTHPVAGRYTGKSNFLKSTFERLNRLLKENIRLRVTDVHVSGDTAIVELEALAQALNGQPYHNRYCWVVYFSDNEIVKVRAYLDSVLVQKLIDENEK